MAFLIHSTDDGRIPPFEYHPATELTPEVGLALAMNGGLLTAVSGDTAPEYISMTQRESAVEEGGEIAVIRVGRDIVFETELSEDGASLDKGDGVTIAAGGLSVTATAGTAAEIVAILDPAEGGGVRVRFSGRAAAPSDETEEDN